jgi:hypothetical protein
MIAEYREYIERPRDPMQRGCIEKAAYPSRRGALQFARHGRRQDGTLRPYHCANCDAWHLGHRPAKRRRTWVAVSR